MNQNISIGGDVRESTVINAENVTLKIAGRAKRTAYYPPGCIGADLSKRNYVKYLIERYHRYRQADASFGRNARFSYAVIFKNVEAKFHAPLYFVPVSRFEELADYLHERIDQTILGRRNAVRGTRNFQTFDEYQLEQMAV